jgi:hypothetical protein
MLVNVRGRLGVEDGRKVIDSCRSTGGGDRVDVERQVIFLEGEWGGALLVMLLTWFTEKIEIATGRLARL